jgi:hypothetical protein
VEASSLSRRQGRAWRCSSRTDVHVLGGARGRAGSMATGEGMAESRSRLTAGERERTTASEGGKEPVAGMRHPREAAESLSGSCVRLGRVHGLRQHVEAG